MIAKTTNFPHRIRRLRRFDRSELVEHFQRLDPPTRRLRFGGHVSDDFIADYARHVLSLDSVCFGAFPDGRLRAVAELRGLLDNWPPRGEVALLVEPKWQDEGIGEALLGRLIAAAQNRGVKTLHMLCLRENRAMQTLARNHHADLDIDIDMIEATLTPPWPTPGSVFTEMFGDVQGLMRTTTPCPTEQGIP